MSPTLNIGITGHRVVAAPEKVAADLAAVFDLIIKESGDVSAREDPADAPPVCRVRLISPLADGADRIFAEVGLAAGASLQCPLPFARADYEADFDSESKAHFRLLIQRADAVFELDGDPEQRDQAYLDVGRIVIAHADVLIAVWDGQTSHGVGGSGDIVAEALKDGLRVIWIDPAGAKPPCLIQGRVHQPHVIDLSQLREVVRSILKAPHSAAPDDSRHIGWRSFLDERDRLDPFGSAFTVFISVLQLRWPTMNLRRRGWLVDSEKDWASLYLGHANLQAICRPCLEGDVASIFARADTLARRYAGLYRSTFLLSFLLSAFAVAIAVVGGQPRSPWNIMAEGLIILCILILILVANRRNWHERWIEYRRLAEQLRPLRFLFPLGVTLPKPRGGHSVAERDEGSAWSDWLAHRLERSLGLPNVAISPPFLNAVYDFAVEAVLSEQIQYHENNALKLKRADHTLERLGLFLFTMTGLMCILDLLLALERSLHTRPMPLAVMGRHAGVSLHFDSAIPILAGLTPAFGAAILGIRNVGEFVRLERRSKSMASRLIQIRDGLASHRDADLKRGNLGEHLQTVAAQLLSETLDWHALLITRRLELPM